MEYLAALISAEYVASLAMQLLLLSVAGWGILHFFGKTPAYRSQISTCLLLCLAFLLLTAPLSAVFNVSFFDVSIDYKPSGINGENSIASSSIVDTPSSSSLNSIEEVSSVLVPGQTSPLPSVSVKSYNQSYFIIVLLNLLGVIWCSGTLFLLVKMLFSLSFLNGFKTATAHRLKQEYSEILEDVAKDFAFQEVPKVFSSFAVESPITVGIKRISVIIPENLLESMNDYEFRSVLYHEFAHIYYRDHLFGVFQRIILALTWWNPFVYYFIAKHTIAREEISDQYAIKKVSADMYAKSLVNLAEKVCLISRLPATAGMASKYIDLKTRIKNILQTDENVKTSISRKLQAMMAMSLLAVSILIAGSSVVFADVSDFVINENAVSQVVQNPSTAGTVEKVIQEQPLAPIANKTVVAVNPLTASGELAKEEQIISDIMQAELSVSDNITLVNRDNLRKALKELQLAQQGMISSESAKKLGKIVGAKYFCSGKISNSGDKTMAIVKIVDIETTITKLAYTTLESKKDAIEAGKSLAGSIEKLITNFTNEKTAMSKNMALKKQVKTIPEGWIRPSVMVIIPEMHVNQRVIDPAAETELVKRLLADKFKVINSEYSAMMQRDSANAVKVFANKTTASEYASIKGVDILIYGEAVSEQGVRLGEFEGCRARVEVKAVKLKSGEILISDSAYGGATDLAETTAGKKALQKAANKLADTFNYKLAAKWNNK